MTYDGRSRLVDFLRGLGALVVFVFLLVGCPVALYAMYGSPLPDRAPSWDEITTTLMRPDTDQSLFLATVLLIGWAAWGMFIVSVCAEAINYLVGRHKSVMPRPVRPLQRLVRDLVATATLTFTAAASLAASASAVNHAHAATSVHATEPGPDAKDTPAPSREDTPGSTASNWTPLLADEPPLDPEPDQRTWRTHIVKRGETLWSLARRTYGSGALYPRIFKSSRTIDQPDGVPSLTDPDVIQPGQRVRLPAARATDEPTSPPRTGSPRPASPPAPSERGEANDNRTPPRPGPTSERATSSEVRSPVVAPPVEHPASPTPSASTDQDESASPLAISLPSGSRIGLGLAAALAVAVAATRLHRRRRRPLATDPDSTGHAPEPPFAEPVRTARKAHLDTYADRDEPIPSDPELVRKDLLATEPDHLIVGTRDDKAVTIPLHGLNLGLSGDGAHATARAITTELLAKAHRDRAEILIPRADAQALFPGEDINDLSTVLEGLTITPSVVEATGHLEAELLRRARIFEMTDQPDVSALRADDPAEPLPTVLLVASVSACRAPLEAIGAFGCRYGIGVLVLGAWPPGTSVVLASDATVLDARGPDADRFTGARLFQLTIGDAVGMLRTVRTATGSEADVVSPPPDADTAAEAGPRVALPIVPPPRPSDGTRRPPVRLDVLGRVRLHTVDGPIKTGLRQRARDLLTYLALHPGGVTRDRASADLWPDDNPDGVVPKFNTAVGNIRSVLRAATGLTEPMYVVHSAGWYRIDPDLVDIDLWRLTAALADAQRATDDADRVKALSLVADCCAGEFASDLAQEWAERHREYLRRTVANALTDLARRVQEGDPERALSALEKATTLDPYSEALYRRVMRLQTRLGRPDDVRHTYQLLAARLAEIDAEPEEETHRLVKPRTPTPDRH
ncbi:hypothetical protein GCM10022254_75360 [Actinomadura meridiana]|uniref:LysM domain-containing protein n=1 Tax=Actinomadura meridiana TaxID=559626 RepID=A0ABP8CR67_9ACTN